MYYLIPYICTIADLCTAAEWCAARASTLITITGASLFILDLISKKYIR